MNIGVAVGLSIVPFGGADNLAMVDAVERGLSLAALDQVVAAYAPGDSSFAFRLVPRAPLARRRRAGAPGAQGLLSSEEGAKVARLAQVWASACDVWGNDEGARDFLFRRHPLLEDRKPVDVVLANEFGRPVVEGILGRLKYGTGV